MTERAVVRVLANRAFGGGQRQGVLGVEPEAVTPRQHAVDGATGEAGKHGEARVKQLGGAAELVDHEAGDERLVGRLQQGERAVHGGEHPAPVDVADHHHRQVGGPGQAHVGHVGVAQVDLRRAARALADHHVVGVPEPGQAFQRDPAEPRRVRAVPHRVGLGLGVAEHHHLAAPVAARLEQHRVHVRGRLDARRGRLHRLRAADLRAIGGDEGVQGHVLRLERRHLYPAAGPATGTTPRPACSCPRRSWCPRPAALRAWVTPFRRSAGFDSPYGVAVLAVL